MNLITGGNGFIGSHLVRHFLADDRPTRIFDLVESSASLSSPQSPFLETITADIRDRTQLVQAAADCTYIFHQAALVSVPESVEHPLACHEINTTGTLNILLAARETGVQRVIVASSSAVYGNDPTIPKQETLRPTPVSPYAASKLAAEHLCSVFYQSYGLETVALRYFNVYGPGQSAASPYAAVIPKFIETIMADRTPIVYGDGEQTRDFIYIEDVVRANLHAAEKPAAPGHVFNIGSGTRISLNTLLEILSDLLGVPTRVEYRAERPGDVRHSVADISKAQQLLDFTPTVPLEEGLRRTIATFPSPP